VWEIEVVAAEREGYCILSFAREKESSFLQVEWLLISPIVNSAMVAVQ
jgi:hypothetical protein